MHALVVDGELFLEALELGGLHFPVHGAHRGRDAHEHLREAEEPGGRDLLLALLDALDHLFRDVARLLHGEGLLEFHGVGDLEEIGVGRDRIEAGDLQIVRLLEADGLLEAVERELRGGVDRVAGHGHLADGADRVGEDAGPAVEVADILGVGVDGGDGVGAEHRVHAVPVLVVEFLVIGEAGVGVEEVDLAEELLGLGEDPVHALLRADVAGEGGDVVGEILDVVHMARHGEDAVALALRQELERLEADAGAGAGQNDAFVVDHGLSPYLSYSPNSQPMFSAMISSIRMSLPKRRL